MPVMPVMPPLFRFLWTHARSGGTALIQAGLEKQACDELSLTWLQLYFATEEPSRGSHGLFFTLEVSASQVPCFQELALGALAEVKKDVLAQTIEKHSTDIAWLQNSGCWRSTSIWSRLALNVDLKTLWKPSRPGKEQPCMKFICNCAWRRSKAHHLNVTLRILKTLQAMKDAAIHWAPCLHLAVFQEKVLHCHAGTSCKLFWINLWCFGKDKVKHAPGWSNKTGFYLAAPCSHGLEGQECFLYSCEDLWGESLSDLRHLAAIELCKCEAWPLTTVPCLSLSYKCGCI